MSKITDLEEGEIMDFDHSTDQIIDDLLKINKISNFRRRKSFFVNYIHSFNISPNKCALLIQKTRLH